MRFRDRVSRNNESPSGRKTVPKYSKQKMNAPKIGSVLFLLEATTRIELVIKALQAPALPLWLRRRLERETGFEPATFSLGC